MAGHARGDGGRQAAAFTADHDDGVVEWWECVDIFAGEVAAENGGGGGGEGGGEVGGVRAHASEGAHAGVNDFLMKQIGAVGREDDAVEGKPVGNAEEGADIARVLHAVEGEGEAAVEGAGREG